MTSRWPAAVNGPRLSPRKTLAVARHSPQPGGRLRCGAVRCSAARPTALRGRPRRSPAYLQAAPRGSFSPRNASPGLGPTTGPAVTPHSPSSDWPRRCSRHGDGGGDWPAGEPGFPGDGAGGRWRPVAAMASVHESLYFNPMMTNGVVHANVFGIKDWVTPYKMALLVLLSELGRAGAQLGLLERRRLNRLLLPLLQVGDGPRGGGKATPGGRLCCGLSRHIALLPRALTCRCRDCSRPSRSPARTWPAPCTSGGRRGRGPPSGNP